MLVKECKFCKVRLRPVKQTPERLTNSTAFYLAWVCPLCNTEELSDVTYEMIKGASYWADIEQKEERLRCDWGIVFNGR